jgi:hypothetical protein
VIEKKLEAGLEEEPHPFSVTRIKGQDECYSSTPNAQNMFFKALGSESALPFSFR